jgi:hypothetical protein
MKSPRRTCKYCSKSVDGSLGYFRVNDGKFYFIYCDDCYGTMRSDIDDHINSFHPRLRYRYDHLRGKTEYVVDDNQEVNDKA